MKRLLALSLVALAACSCAGKGEVDKPILASPTSDRVLQSSDFEFNRHGVSGESITVIAYSGSAGPQEHEIKRIEVNRPFYCLSMKNGFPLFANKVTAL